MRATVPATEAAVTGPSLPLEQVTILCGQAPIHEFVRFVMTRGIGQHDEIALTREWQRGNARLEELSSTEADAAEAGEIEPLPSTIAAPAEAALQDPATQKSLAFLPHRWAMVELDRLIVWQKHVNLGFSSGLQASLSRHPGLEDLLEVATGRRRRTPAVHVTTLAANNFSFSSSSTDARVLGAVPLDPANVSGYQPYGNAAAVLAVFIGYSMNVMWAVRRGARVMLINGTHRAHALRALGVTRCPCIVSEVASESDLDLVGLPEESESSRSLFSRTRPPLLKDFFDERLCKTISCARSHTVISLDLKFERTRHPAHL